MIKRCSHKGCKNFEYVLDGGFCQKHVKGICSYKWCIDIVDKGGVCIIHGAERIPQKRCSKKGYTKQALNGGVCQRHAVLCELCSFEGCNSKVEHGGICNMHCKMIKQSNPKTPYNSFMAL
jgi:hypothetical protein